MNPIISLEQNLAKLYARAPRLPERTRRWIAVNSWWISLVIAIIVALVVLLAIPGIFALATTSAYSVTYAYSDLSIPVLVVNAIVTLALGAASAVLLFAAVKPLKELRRRGWYLLFCNELVGAVSVIVSFFITIRSANVFSLIWDLLVVAIELYVLFQIRSQFSGRVADAVEAKIVTQKK